MHLVPHIGGSLDGEAVEHDTLPSIYIHHIGSIDVRPSNGKTALTQNLLLERYRLTEIDGNRIYQYIERNR